ASVSHRYLHSFPTRRSSDLAAMMPGRSPLRNGWSPGCGTPVRSARNAPLVTIVTAYWDALNAILAGALRLRQSATTEAPASAIRSEEHTSELQSRSDLVCRL